MRIALLSGAYKNAGDFLIVQRCCALISYVYPNCVITQIPRNKDLSEKLTEVNESDVIVLAGGPALRYNVYPDIIPLVPNLQDIKPPIFAMALGLGGSGGKRSLLEYSFGKSSNVLWQRINEDGFAIGCRDVNSADVMRRNGFTSVMTGCAAWYDFDEKSSKSERVKKIVVSDPESPSNYNAALNLLRYLQERFRDSEITVIFHRGTDSDSYTSIKRGERLRWFTSEIEKLGIHYKDISYSMDGFQIYDDCFMHIGFRVHAHIYALSKRLQSILISEDIRGDSFNETIGFPSVRTNSEEYLALKSKYLKKAYKSLFDANNRYLLEEIDSVIEHIERTDGEIYKWAFTRMQFYLNSMIAHVKTIESVIK